MKIAFVSPEVVPFSKTGGLADVSGSLPKALEKLGAEVRVFTPKYYSIDEWRYKLHYVWEIGEMHIRVNDLPRPVHVFKSKLPDSNVEIYFIDSPHYFNREYLYTNDYDEDERFILFNKAVIETLQRLRWTPNIIHSNDWQAGLIPLYIKDNYSWDKMFADTSTVFTIHNIGYQGKFSKDALMHAEINGSYFYPGGPAEFQNDVSFLKCGINFADIITTVSETYAEEILTAEYGSGMENVLLQRKSNLHGILNGVDYSDWDPQTDKLIPHNYSIDDLSGKLLNKKSLLKHLNLPYDENIPLIGIISRLASQKGFDLFADASEELLKLNAQWIILGSGEPHYEELTRYLTGAHPESFANYIGFNNELAHLIEAGADMFLMPSHYEPCGLNQIYSLKYGTVPIVRKTGGLADTVRDWDEHLYLGNETGNGFSFNDYTPYALIKSIERAVNTYRSKDVWLKIQKNGMNEDYCWEKSARRYLEIYSSLSDKRKNH